MYFYFVSIKEVNRNFRAQFYGFIKNRYNKLLNLSAVFEFLNQKNVQ